MLDDSDKQKLLDRLLQTSPDEVLALFQTELKGHLSSMEAGVFVLAHPDATDEDKKQAIEALQQRIKMVKSGLDFTQDYLKKRAERQSRKPPKR